MFQSKVARTGTAYGGTVRRNYGAGGSFNKRYGKIQATQLVDRPATTNAVGSQGLALKG